MQPITVSDFFRINGIETVVDQERILGLIGSRVPVELWGHVQITPAQAALLGRLHGYRVTEPELDEGAATAALGEP